MNGFLKTLIYGFAAIGVLALAAILTLLLKVKADNTINYEYFRSKVLTPEEQSWLAQMKKRAAEPPAEHHAEAASEEPRNVDEMLSQIAEMANAQKATQLVTDLRRARATIEEERQAVERQAAEAAQARADLARVERQLGEQQRAIDDARRQLAAEQARWAAAQADNLKQVNVLNDVQRKRMAEQARLFEQMKDNAWQTLRRMEPKEIASYLALMGEKKAARMLVLAQQDQDNPSLVMAIHNEMRRLDKDAVTGDVLDWQAKVYAFMPAAQVVAYIAQSTPEDITGLLRRMAAAGDKRRAEILTTLRNADPARELAVQRLLAAAEPAAPASAGTR